MHLHFSRRSISTVAVMLALLPIHSAFSQLQTSATPEAVVQSFYRFHFSHNMDFSRQNVQRRRQWLSPQLLGLLINEFHREDEYARAHPKESFVPYMEGDPFTNSQEYPSSFRVGKTVVSDEKANVSVLLLWKGRGKEGGDKRNLDIQLVREGGKWVINNILNKDNGDDLVANLKREKYLP